MTQLRMIKQEWPIMMLAVAFVSLVIVSVVALRNEIVDDALEDQRISFLIDSVCQLSAQVTSLEEYQILGCKDTDKGRAAKSVTTIGGCR